MDRVRGLSPTGISARTAKVIASTRVIESLSGLTATTSLPSGDTDTAAAEIGRLRSTAEVGRTAETVAFGEIIARAAGSGTGRRSFHRGSARRGLAVRVGWGLRRAGREQEGGQR